MPKRVDFSSATPREIKNLTYNSALKHSLDNINGTTLGTVKYILKKTKKVNLFKHSSLIEATFAKAVEEGKLVLDDTGWYKWPNHQDHYRLRRERLEKKRLMNGKRIGITSTQDSASSENITKRLARKRKRSLKKGQASSIKLPSTDSPRTTQGNSLSSHSLTFNGQQSQIKAGVLAAGSSTVMSSGGVSNQDHQVSNQGGSVAKEGRQKANKKKKSASKRKRSKSQNNDEAGASGAKKHNDSRLYKGRRHKKD